MQASLESCEETFQLCILRLLTSMIPTSVHSHASPSAGRWCFPFFLSPNYKNDHKQDRERVFVIKTWSSLAVFLWLLTATGPIDVGQHHSGPTQYPFKSLPFNRCRQTLNIDEEIPFYIMASKNRNKYYLCRYQARIDYGENNDEEGANCTVPCVGQVVHICQRQKNQFWKSR